MNVFWISYFTNIVLLWQHISSRMSNVSTPQITEEWDDTASKDVDKFKMDVTTHVSIHTLHLDGLRELFRHFLRLSDGAILEVGILIVVIKIYNS